MQSSTNKEVCFKLYKYRFDDFNNFRNFDEALSNNCLVHVCSFNTEEEFKLISENLFGLYVFYRVEDKMVFLYHRVNNYKPFKKYEIHQPKMLVTKNSDFPLYEEEMVGKVICSISKNDKQVSIIDEFGININGLMPEVVQSIKRLDCDSFMCEGRIGYVGPERKNMYDCTGSFFVAVSDIFYLNGRDFSEESFLFRQTLGSKIVGWNNNIYINKHKLINSFEECSGGVVRFPKSNFDSDLFVIKKED